MASTTVYFYQNDTTRKALAKIFSTVQELDKNHKAQVEFIYENTSFRSDKKLRLKQLLNLLKTHSVNKGREYLGVCFLSISNIIKVFEDTYKKKISERAVQYLLSDLEELGLIQRIPTLRKSDNRQSTNIYRTLKLKSSTEESSDPAKTKHDNDAGKTSDKKTQGRLDTGKRCPVKKFAHKAQENLHSKKALSLLKPLSKSKDIRERNASASQKTVNQASKLLNFVPKKFKDMFKVISTTPEEVFEYWKITKLVCEKRKNLTREETLTMIEQVIDEFRKAYKAAVRGKFAMKNPFGFYWSVAGSHAFAFVAQKTNCKITTSFLEYLTAE